MSGGINIRYGVRETARGVDGRVISEQLLVTYRNRADAERARDFLARGCYTGDLVRYQVGQVDDRVHFSQLREASQESQEPRPRGRPRLRETPRVDRPAPARRTRAAACTAEPAPPAPPTILPASRPPSRPQATAYTAGPRVRGSGDGDPRDDMMIGGD